MTNSAAVKRLSAKVTVDGAGTGELRFGDVPARFGVDADASGANLRVPTVTYKALGGVNTLDGHLGVEGGLIDRRGGSATCRSTSPTWPPTPPCG